MFMDVKILEEVFWGYSKLAVVVDSAFKKLNLNYNFEIIGNPNLFKNHKIENPPALIINGKILVEGYVPDLEELIDIIEEYMKDLL